ncbi:unnamed protein product, partial [Closterium sp. NIES-54]
VRGDDLANLALTRVVQRDIWESQFPATCKGRRILLAEWVDGPTPGPTQTAAAAGAAGADLGAFGMGTQIQVMSAFLSIAVRHNRTLVVAPGTYSRANNSACQGIYGLRVAVHISDISTEESSIIQSLEKGTSLSGKGIPDFNMTKEAEFLKGINFAPPNLETDVWPGEGFAGCLVREADGEKPATIDKNFKGVGGEVFIFRPIVSVHVANGDAVLEGGGSQGGSFPEGGSRVKLRSLGVYMYFAYQLQLHVPTINHAWLSTDAQSTLEEAKQLRDWSFLYSEHPSQQTVPAGGVAAGDGSGDLSANDKTVAVKFANLLIAAECDFFVGMLGSNWNRLVDGLRSTNGRLFSGYMALSL